MVRALDGGNKAAARWWSRAAKWERKRRKGEHSPGREAIRAALATAKGCVPVLGTPQEGQPRGARLRGSTLQRGVHRGAPWAGRSCLFLTQVGLQVFPYAGRSAFDR